MKKLISLLLTFSIVLLSFCSLCVLSSCNDNESKKDSTQSTKSTEPSTVSREYTKPKQTLWESSDNSLGARYVFTLDEINQMLNDALVDMGAEKDTEEFENSKWQKLSEKLTDDNGVKYDTYYFDNGDIAYTCAVENESKKVMNLGCGCSFEKFNDKNSDYQHSVILMSSLIACVAGGYETKDIDFMYNLFVDTINSNKAVYYNNALYKAQYDTKEDSSVLFMVSPATDAVLTLENTVEYSKLELTKVESTTSAN